MTTNISAPDSDFGQLSGPLPRHFVPGYYQPVPRDKRHSLKGEFRVTDIPLTTEH